MAQFGRYSSGNYLEGASRTLMSGIQLHQRGKIADRQLAISEGNLEVSQGQLELAQGKQTSELQKIPVYQRQVTEKEMATMEGGLGAIDKELGTKLVNTTKPVFNIIKNITAKGGNKFDIYTVLKQDWPKHVKPAQEGLKKMIAEAMANNDVEAVEKYGEMLNEISSEDFLDNELFPMCSAHAKELEKQAEVKTPKLERLYPTTEGWQERGDAVGKLQPKKSGSGAGARAVTTWRDPEGKVHNLPNNVQPPKGSMKVNVSQQEMTSLRQDRAYIKREISTLKKKIARGEKFPDIEMYQREAEGAKEDLESYNMELEDLKIREDELLGKAPKEEGKMNKMPSASQHKGKIIKDTKTGNRYKSNGNSWVKQ